MILDRRPGEPLGASLDRAVERGQLTAGDAETVELFGEWLTYGPSPKGGTVAQLRWASAFVRTVRGCSLILGPDATREQGYSLAVRYERAAARP